MKALVVYESMFGNTETIARAVADGLRETLDVTFAEVTGMPRALGHDLLVVGAPTHAFGLSRPATRADAARQGTVRPDAVEVGLREYLDSSPPLTGIIAAAFDTRIDKAFVPGSAAHRAHRHLHRLGCRTPVGAQSFRVAGITGPLVAGEAERGRRWGVALAAAVGAAV
jgi:Flavodoxin